MYCYYVEIIGYRTSNVIRIFQTTSSKAAPLIQTSFHSDSIIDLAHVRPNAVVTTKVGRIGHNRLCRTALALSVTSHRSKTGYESQPLMKCIPEPHCYTITAAHSM